MKIRYIVPLVLCLLLIVFFIKKRTQTSNGPIAIEGPVDNFVLIDHQGVFHELYDYTDQQAVVLITQANGCSINRETASYLNGLKEQYEPQRVKFLMINASPQDDRASIVKEAEAYNIHFSILEDKAQVISADLRIQQAGEAIVFNPQDWSIVYRGAVAPYLKDAIDALIEKRPLAVSKTDVNGCAIDMEMVSSKRKLFFVKDVAPILINRCLPCHNESRDDLWSMKDYEAVASWSSLLREGIRTKQMPPWEGDESLSTEEIRTLIRWVEQGALRGDGVDPLKSY